MKMCSITKISRLKKFYFIEKSDLSN